MRTLMLTATLLAAATSAAWAQLENRIAAHVPFDYSVSGVSAKSGPVTFLVNGTGRVTVASPGASVMRLGNRTTKVTKNAQLVFHVYDGKRVLRAIEMGTSGSVEFASSREEREWNQMGLTARIEVVALSRAAD